MAVTNPFKITYGGQAVGGSSDYYQLHGPYVIEKSNDDFRLVFDVVVVGTSFADLQTKSDTLETAFRKRLSKAEVLEIEIGTGGNKWTYTVGSNLLEVHSTISKTGNPDTDKGFSRAYTCNIQAKLPSNNDGGLRSLEVLVEVGANGLKTVTMRGTYTAKDATSAVDMYKNNFAAEATAYRNAIDATRPWELVTENYSLDRERSTTWSAGVTPFPHACNFVQQWVQILAAQSDAAFDDTLIKDHRISFTDVSSFSGDSGADIYRLRRCNATYECAVDAAQGTDIYTVYETKVKPHLKSLFVEAYQPSSYGVEETRISIDRTGNRISAQFGFIYQKQGGSTVIELQQSLSYRESRTIDYTPVHDGGELSAEADLGFMILERVWNRNATILGYFSPRTRIYQKSGGNDTRWGGLFGINGPDSRSSTETINKNGWNLVQSTSQSTPSFIGNPDEGTQLLTTMIQEQVTERYHEQPRGRNAGPRGKNGSGSSGGPLGPSSGGSIPQVGGIGGSQSQA